MFGFNFGKKKVLQNQDGVPNYHLGPIYDGEGAARFVLDMEFGLPLYNFRGAGRLAGSLSVFQPPQIRQFQSVPVSSIGSGGTQAGQFIMQALTDQESAE